MLLSAGRDFTSGVFESSGINQFNRQMGQGSDGGNVIGCCSSNIGNNRLIRLGQSIEQAALTGIRQSYQNHFGSITVSMSSTDLVDNALKRRLARS